MESLSKLVAGTKRLRRGDLGQCVFRDGTTRDCGGLQEDGLPGLQVVLACGLAMNLFPDWSWDKVKQGKLAWGWRGGVNDERVEEFPWAEILPGILEAGTACGLSGSFSLRLNTCFSDWCGLHLNRGCLLTWGPLCGNKGRSEEESDGSQLGL